MRSLLNLNASTVSRNQLRLLTALLFRRLWNRNRDKISFESLSSWCYATDIKTLLCKWFLLNKRNFSLLFSRSDDNKGRLSFQFIYEKKCFLLCLDTFSIKQKDVLLLFQLFFLLTESERIFAMRRFFIVKFLLWCFSIASSGWKSYRNFEVDLKSSLKKKQQTLIISVNLISWDGRKTFWAHPVRKVNLKGALKKVQKLDKSL